MFCKPQYHRRDSRSIAGRLRRHARPQQYSPLTVAEAYSLPIPSNGGTLDGSGQTIGIVELGGAFSQGDLSSYLQQLGLPDNRVNCINVGGGSQQSDPGGADVEVMLDACIIAALAPRAKINIYFGTNDDQGMPSCVQKAYSDGCDVVSISWGSPETQSPASYRQTLDAILQQCAQEGCNVYVAAGDNGSRDGTGSAVTDYPASSPWTIGCGGTSLQLVNGRIASETVWNDGTQGGATGGGFSTYYSKPGYQNVLVPGSRRGVPDVSGVADPETGWVIMAGGSLQSVGGTSAVAPMWAAINALLNQAAGKRIAFADLIYYANQGWFNDTITGNNGDYQAGPNWDACTGLGSPNGAVMFNSAPVSPPPVSPPPVSPPPVSPPPVNIEQIVAVIDQDFASIERQIQQTHPLIGHFLVPILKEVNALIDQDLSALASGMPSQRENWIGRLSKYF